jgi:ribosomal protein L20
LHRLENNTGNHLFEEYVKECSSVARCDLQGLTDERIDKALNTCAPFDGNKQKALKDAINRLPRCLRRSLARRRVVREDFCTFVNFFLPIKAREETGVCLDSFKGYKGTQKRLVRRTSQNFNFKSFKSFFNKQTSIFDGRW